ACLLRGREANLQNKSGSTRRRRRYDRRNHRRPSGITRKRTMKKLSLLIRLVFGSLTGCTLAPKYERTVAPISQTWPSGPAYASNQLGGFMTNAAAEIGWREFFQDARLQKLIDLALTNNRD